MKIVSWINWIILTKGWRTYKRIEAQHSNRTNKFTTTYWTPKEEYKAYQRNHMYIPNRNISAPTYQNLPHSTYHKHNLVHIIDNGLSSVINLNEFRPFTMIFHARCKHDCTGRPSSSDQVLPSTEPTMYPHLSFRQYSASSRPSQGRVIT